MAVFISSVESFGVVNPFGEDHKEVTRDKDEQLVQDFDYVFASSFEWIVVNGVTNRKK
jgi:hypothetical protein